MKKILVTGSGGQLGQTIRERSNNLEKHIFDFKDSSDLDITNPDNLEEAFEEGNYDYCINCAAYTNVEQAEKTPEIAYMVNAEGVKNLAEICKKHHTILIHISTDYVFDGKKQEPYSVNDETSPINEYGKSKLAGEKLIRQVIPNHFIIRTSWLYSKKYGHNFYRTILRKAHEATELRITDQQKGCPTDTVTLTRFILEKIIIAGDMPFGLYHVTDGTSMTWYDFAKSILEENGLTDSVKLVLDRNYRTFAARPKNSVLI